MSLAPIIVFAYNRPRLLSQTLESLGKNNLAGESELFIFCDGPKRNANDNDLKNIAESRRIANETRCCERVNVYESDANKGLGPSIIAGVTKIVNEYGKVIVLEDDLITSPYFLEYMNAALDKYEDEEKVMHVSAYMFPVKRDIPDLFFYSPATCWGWSTWKRAWDKLDTEPKRLKKKLKDRGLYEYFNLEGHGDFALQLDLNIMGLLNTWAIRWYASVMLNGGLCLHPRQSYVRNIGFGDDASNTKRGLNIFHIDKLADEVNLYDIPIEESLVVREAMMEFNDSNRKNVMIKFLFKNYTNNKLIRKIFFILFRIRNKK